MNKYALVIAVALAATFTAKAQGNVPIVGPSDPTPPTECHGYQWPSTLSPCPEVQIKQKHDHTPIQRYREMGWDTVVTCANRQLEMSCTPYIPVQYFDGRYYVDVIPYNPPDTTYYIGYNPTLDANNPNKQRLDINSDDKFAPSATQIAFPFFFFGQRKTQFRLGDNGMVTFCDNATFGSGDHCAYSINTSDQLPWTSSSNTPGHTESEFGRMHDGIYGVFEDTHPQTSTVSYPQGIYYGVIDDYPCRKIIASWNDIPLYYAQSNNRQTYQIVCYEGSNIIEVHVKRRGCCSSTNSGRGIIGIQNATGQPQVTGADGTPTMFVQAGEPGAFWPTGHNIFTSTEDFTAYRFTPQGSTNKNYKWYRIVEGQDSVQLSTDPTDPNGYYIPMGEDYGDDCPNLTRAIVSPTEPTRYVFELRFMNANNNQYVLRDTIFVGVDTLNDLTLRDAANPTGVGKYDICAGQTAHMRLEFTDLQEADDIRFSAYRISNGAQIELNSNFVAIGEDNEASGLVFYNVDVNTNNLPTEGMIENKIDSVMVVASVDFISGCFNSTTMLLRTFPNFDITDTAGICKGETYHWNANGQNYTQNTNPANTVANLHSEPGCDSTMRLFLTVYDVSHTVDHVVDCKPIRWLNGHTYSTSNTSTYESDTIVLQNKYGCDSVVQLEFTIHPLTAKMKSSLEAFDLDHLNVELTDVSTGNDSRTWRFPYGIDQHGSTAYWSIPADYDRATIWLIANSPYGCIDSTSITLPLNKEHFWVPNAFTPDNPAGNSTFGSVSTKTVQQEMLIYNRRGELVFKCEGVDCTWDGHDLNGNPSPQGTYVYIIRYTNEFEPSVTKIKNGTVTLIR